MIKELLTQVILADDIRVFLVGFIVSHSLGFRNSHVSSQESAFHWSSL